MYIVYISSGSLLLYIAYYSIADKVYILSDIFFWYISSGLLYQRKLFVSIHHLYLERDRNSDSDMIN
jgi:hypothetical protein